eukprot:1186323-Prorocentrum_minimum.AAC.1
MERVRKGNIPQIGQSDKSIGNKRTLTRATGSPEFGNTLLSNAAAGSPGVPSRSQTCGRLADHRAESSGRVGFFPLAHLPPTLLSLLKGPC